MNAKELRPGNFVTIDNPVHWPELNGVTLKVTEVTSHVDKDFPESTGTVGAEDTRNDWRESYSQFDQFVKGIELTEEWLIKFGFHKDLGYNILLVDKLYLRIELPIKGSSRKTVDTIIAWDHTGRWITGQIGYVHQLQNLFFAMTGTELELK